MLVRNTHIKLIMNVQFMHFNMIFMPKIKQTENVFFPYFYCFALDNTQSYFMFQNHLLCHFNFFLKIWQRTCRQHTLQEPTIYMPLQLRNKPQKNRLTNFVFINNDEPLKFHFCLKSHRMRYKKITRSEITTKSKHVVVNVKSVE